MCAPAAVREEVPYDQYDDQGILGSLMDHSAEEGGLVKKRRLNVDKTVATRIGRMAPEAGWGDGDTNGCEIGTHNGYNSYQDSNGCYGHDGYDVYYGHDGYDGYYGHEVGKYWAECGERYEDGMAPDAGWGWCDGEYNGYNEKIEGNNHARIPQADKCDEYDVWEDDYVKRKMLAAAPWNRRAREDGATVEKFDAVMQLHTPLPRASPLRKGRCTSCHKEPVLPTLQPDQEAICAECGMRATLAEHAGMIL